ncbi:unnamed protein product, partial [Ascophyllum nodosum]
MPLAPGVNFVASWYRTPRQHSLLPVFELQADALPFSSGSSRPACGARLAGPRLVSSA